jgi:hypothetical protein
MTSYTVRLQRSNDIRGFMSSSSIGSDAQKGMLSIPGVEQLEVITGDEHSVTLAYKWTGEEKFWQTDEYLKKFGVCRVWPH